MKKVKISAFFAFVFLLLAFNVLAAQISSSNYKQNVVVSEGGENTTSSSYKISIVVGIINGIISSASYINNLGFFHTWLLADGQPCTSAGQCEGGYCCSSVCASSACPTPSTTTTGGGAAAAAAGGGGGGTIIEKVKDFDVEPSSVKEHVALGAAKTISIKVRNKGNAALSFSLDVVTINDFVFLSDTSFSLEAEEEKEVELNIIGKKLGSYLGEIQVESEGIKKTIDVIVDVESEQVLFDVKMNIPSAYKEVAPGDELKAQITLINVGPSRKVDATTTYMIKNKLGRVIHESSETFAVEKQISYVKAFKIPKDAEPGDYLAVVELKYEKSFAVSSELFRVVEEKSLIEEAAKITKPLTFTFLIIVGVILLLMYLLMPRVKIFKRMKIRKCYDAINDAIDAINSNDIVKAKKLYAKARKLYDALDKSGKREVYDELIWLYNKLR